MNSFTKVYHELGKLPWKSWSTCKKISRK